jgi:hypothetical protein
MEHVELEGQNNLEVPQYEIIVERECSLNGFTKLISTQQKIHVYQTTNLLVH